MSRFGYIRHRHGVEGHVVELPQLGDVLVHAVPDASLAERALLVLLTTGSGVTQCKAFAAGCIVDTSQSVGCQRVDCLQAIDELLLTAALESVKGRRKGQLNLLDLYY